MKKIILIGLINLIAGITESSAQKIYEIYPAGGAGGSYNLDAIILQGPANMSLNGWSLQHANATSNFIGNRFSFTALHSFNSSGFFYFETGVLGPGAPLPFVANANFGFSLSNNGGKLALVNNDIPLSGACPLPNGNIVDFVGYSGSSVANCAEGTPVAWSGSAFNSMLRISDVGNNFVDFMISSTPLPIELSNFEAIQQNTSVLLHWSTASEKNNSFFSIERSADGNRYESIGTKDGAGNSSTGERYTFTDENPLNGNNYYRLKQVDEDGNFEYSPIRIIRWGKTASVALYPNPATSGTVNILYESTYEGLLTIAVTDGCGKELEHQSIDVNKGENQIPVSTSALPEGVYWMKITSPVETQVVPFIVK